MRLLSLLKFFILLLLGLLVFFILGMTAFLFFTEDMIAPEVGEIKSDYQIHNVNVVDVVNSQVLSNQRVVVKSGVIVDIRSESVSKTEAGIGAIDGTGKYLIPGFWDNHSTLLKTSPFIDFPLYIANGVTSLRSNLSCPNEDKASLYACMRDKADWKQKISQREMLGPAILGWGTFPLNGDNKRHPDSPPFHGAGTKANAEELVDFYSRFPKSHQPYFLKTYNWLPPEAYKALANQAKTRGFELAGHKPRQVSIVEAVEHGQRSFAHARLFLYECSRIADKIKAKKVQTKRLLDFYRQLIEHYDPQKCEAIYQKLADNDAYLNPTLMTRRNDYLAVAGLSDKILGIEYAHYLIKLEWLEDIGALGKDLSREDVEIFKKLYELSASTIANAHHAGVTILAGSDSWSEYNVPGFSLHEEMAAMYDAGMDSFSVLRAATINGAKYFGVDEQIGSIDIGKRADMVLLYKNPVVDIKNTLSIDSVFQGERVYSSDKLRALKKSVKELANSERVTAKLLGLWLQNPRGF